MPLFLRDHDSHAQELAADTFQLDPSSSLHIDSNTGAAAAGSAVLHDHRFIDLVVGGYDARGTARNRLLHHFHQLAHLLRDRYHVVALRLHLDGERFDACRRRVVVGAARGAHVKAPLHEHDGACEPAHGHRELLRFGARRR